MKKYSSADLDTGVIAYEAGAEGISVKFRDGSVYIYTDKSAGPTAIAEMKVLAKKGVGLTTYINQHVRDNYEKKLR